MSSPCPSSAELAALAAGRLPAARAAAVRAHLASCEDCYEAVTEAAAFAEEEGAAAAGPVATSAGRGPLAARREGEPTAAGARGGRTAPSAGAAAGPPSGPEATGPAGHAPGTPATVLPLRPRRPAAAWVRRLSVAAALVAAAGVALWWNASRRAGVEALYAAAADPRPGDVRLSGAPYQAPEPVLRGEREAPRWRLLAAAERARAAAQEDPSARHLHALGVAHLLLGETGPAIAALERARRAAPGEERIASDLAAALIHRGLAEDRPEDAAAGLDLLLAVGEDDLTPEDRFNRALALERIGLRDEAIAEWEAYLESDAESPWAEEARERLARLRASSAAPRGPEAEDLEREVLEELLPRWAEAQHAERLGLLASARESAERYRARHGDSSLTEIVESVELGDERELALALASYRAARRAYRSEDISTCRAELARFPWDERAGVAPQLGLFAALTDSSCSYLRGDLERAAVAAAHVLAAEQERPGHPVLRGLAAWMEGLVAHSASRPAQALSAYGSAAAAFRQAGDRARTARLESLQAFLHDYLGQDEASWRFGTSALVHAGLAADQRYQVLSWLVQRATTEGHLHLAALAAEAARDAAERSSSAEDLADAWRRLGSVATQAGRHHIARRALEGALGAARNITDDDLRARITAYVSLDLAALRLLDSPAAALELAGLSAGQDAIAADLYLQRALIEASALDAMGRSAEAAAVAATVDRRFTRERSTLALPSVRHSLFERQQALTDLTLEILARGSRPEAAFLLRDEWRSRELRRAPEPQEEWVTASARHPGTAFYVHLALPRELLVWRIAQGRAALHRQGLERDSLARELGRTVGALRSDDAALERAAKLAPLLLPDLGDEREVVVVPDALTSAIPFAALVRSRGAARPVVLTPSLSLWFARHRQERQPMPCVLVVKGARHGGRARPDLLPLRHVDDEARAVAGLYPCAEVASDFEPLRHDGARFGVVHYVGHTFSGPNGGFLLLEQPGGPEPMDGSALEALDLGGRIVVLSSCSGAVGLPSNPRGAEGLAMNFLVAGTDVVVANVWPLEDELASRFAIALHRRLAAGWDAKSALFEAQRHAARDPLLRGGWAGWQIVSGGNA